MLIDKKKRNLKVKIKDEFVKKSDAELFVLSDDEKSMSIVNEVGARIIELADGSKTLEEITEIIISEYAVDRKHLENDISSFIKDMKSSGLFILDNV